jgi:hypothetical protein
MRRAAERNWKEFHEIVEVRFGQGERLYHIALITLSVVAP